MVWPLAGACLPGPVCRGCRLNTPHACSPAGDKWTWVSLSRSQGAGRAGSPQRPRRASVPCVSLVPWLMAASCLQRPSPASPDLPLWSGSLRPPRDPAMPRVPALPPHSGPSLTSPPVKVMLACVRLQGLGHGPLWGRISPGYMGSFVTPLLSSGSCCLWPWSPSGSMTLARRPMAVNGLCTSSSP